MASGPGGRQARACPRSALRKPETARSPWASRTACSLRVPWLRSRCHPPAERSGRIPPPPARLRLEDPVETEGIEGLDADGVCAVGTCTGDGARGTLTVGVGTVTFGTVTVGTVTVGTVTFGTVMVGVVTVGVETVGVFTGVDTVGTVSDGTVSEGTVRALLRWSCPRDATRASATPSAHPSTRAAVRAHPPRRCPPRDFSSTRPPSRVRITRHQPPVIVRDTYPFLVNPKRSCRRLVPARERGEDPERASRV